MIAKPLLQDILDSTLEKIAREANLTNTQKGSVTRILTEAYLTQIVELYNYVDQMFERVSLSKATGYDLDIKGKILQCSRKDATETDENYRYRIAKQPYVIARENLDAIEQNLLQIDGVKKIKIDTETRGGGYFDAYIITDDLDTSSSILSTAQRIVNDNKAKGIIGEAKSPIKDYCDISFIIESNRSISDTAIKMLIESHVKGYLSNCFFGKLVNFEELCEELMTSFNFKRVAINSVKINNTPIYNYSSFKVGEFSRLIFSSLDVNAVD